MPFSNTYHAAFIKGTVCKFCPFIQNNKIGAG